MTILNVSVGRDVPAPLLSRASGESAWRRIWPLVLLMYASLLPNEVHVVLAGQYFYPPRIVEFLVLPWLLSRMLQGRFTFHPVDAGMFVGCAWMVLSFSLYYESFEGATRAFVIVFDMIVPYLIARIVIRSISDLRRTLIYFAPAIFIAGTMVVAESLIGTSIVKPLASSVFGHLPRFEGDVGLNEARSGDAFRFGLLRAYGGFPHPILAGLFLVSSQAIYASSGIRGWPFRFGVLAGFCAFLTVSSTAIVAFLLFVLLFAYDQVQRVTAFLSWRLLVLFASMFALVVELGTQSGLVNLVIRFTLDPSTGYYRRLIWKFGTISVEKHPWIGIGFTAYERLSWMVPSIDNYWLLLAVRHGLIVPFAILATVLPTIIMLSLRSLQFSEVNRRLFVGLASSLFIMSLLAFTVALFGGMTTWFYLVLGLSLSLALEARDDVVFANTSLRNSSNAA